MGHGSGMPIESQKEVLQLSTRLRRTQISPEESALQDLAKIMGIHSRFLLRTCKEKPDAPVFAETETSGFKISWNRHHLGWQNSTTPGAIFLRPSDMMKNAKVKKELKKVKPTKVPFNEFCDSWFV